MAKITSFPRGDDGDGYYYIVESDNGRDRKQFYNEEEARNFYRYLQGLDDQHRIVEQNDQIIEGQRKGFNHPRKVVQELDPEYAEWLRFKKATDPAFIAWKAEEEKKKQQQRDLEEQKRRETNEQIEALRRSKLEQTYRSSLSQMIQQINLCEQGLHALSEILPDVKSLYKIRCKPSVSFFAKRDWYNEGKFYQFGLDDSAFRNHMSNFLTINILALTSEMENLKRKMKGVEESPTIVDIFSYVQSDFQQEIKKFKLNNMATLDKYVSDIIEMEKLVQNFSVSGVIDSIKVNGIKSKYMSENRVYHDLAHTIKKKLTIINQKYPQLGWRYYDSRIWGTLCIF
jgi:hypothetical protein